MTRDEADQLDPGIYRIYWRMPKAARGVYDQTTSVAAVGHDKKGRRWFVPTDWNDHVPSYNWALVDRATFLCDHRLGVDDIR